MSWSSAPDPDRTVRTIVVVCPDWPLVAADLGGDPHGRGDTDPTPPAAVLHANRVVATNATARAHDVVVGLRRREAQGRCPHLVVLPHDPARDARRFEPVVAALTTLAPRVEITAAGVCSFATRGPSRYHGGDAELARLAAERATAAAGVAVLVGVADGPAVARLAAGRAAPARPHVVAPGRSAEFLAPAPLASVVGLAPDPDVLEVWQRLGIATLGAVADLPTSSVLGRFGLEGLWVHRLARGLDPQPLVAADPPPGVHVAVDLDPPAERSDTVAFTARALADELLGMLGARGLACTRVVITLHTEHGEEHERCWRLDGAGGGGGGGPAGGSGPGAGRSTAAAVADRVRWQLDGWLGGPVGTRPTAGISRMTLAPDAVEPARGRQVGFWGGEAGAGERVLQAVARVEALVGPESVRVLEGRGGRHPGEAVAAVPVGVVDLTSARQVVMSAEPPWPGRLPPPSPSLVHDPAPPVELLTAEGRAVGVSGRGELRGRPARLRVGRSLVEVAAWAGPWPVEERWWDLRSHHRRARLQVLAADGRAHLLGRSSGGWWLDATYA